MIAGNFVSLPICCIHPSSATYFAAGTSHVGLTADDACLESDTGNMQSTVAGNCVVRACWKHQDLYKHWEFQSWCHCRERIFVWICSKMFEIVSLEKAQFCCHHCFAMLLQLSPIQLRSNYNDLIHSKKYGETTTCGSRCLQFACFASGITKQKSSVGQGHHHRWGLPSFEHLQFDVCRMATDAYSLTQS